MSEQTKVTNVDKVAAKTAVKNTRKVNKASEPDLENVSLKEMDKNKKYEDGSYRGTPLSREEVEEHDETYRAGLTFGKKITVETISGGNMHYFDADKWIRGEPTTVPDSSWLQLQIASGKIKLSED